MRLLTNNPHKVACLCELGVNVEQRLPLHPTVNESNFKYLLTKALRMSHSLNVGTTSQHREGGVTAGGRREVYLSSADWMPRNFVRRVEVMFPVDDESLRDRLIDEILAISREDNVKARMLLPDGTYRRVRPGNGDPSRRSQQRFIELARQAAAASPGQRDDSGEYVVGGHADQTKDEVSDVQPALLGKPSLPS